MFLQVTEYCPSNCKGMYTEFIMLPYADLFDKCILHAHVYYCRVLNNKFTKHFTYYKLTNF